MSELKLVFTALFHYRKYANKACEGLQEGGVITRFILTGLFGSYDTFTYLPEQESFSFISVHALQ